MAALATVLAAGFILSVNGIIIHWLRERLLARDRDRWIEELASQRPSWPDPYGQDPDLPT